jgi:hypothetical protein
MKDVQAKEKPSALKKRKYSTLNMKFLHFFSFSWVIFAILNPDPYFQYGFGLKSNVDPCGSRSTALDA